MQDAHNPQLQGRHHQRALLRYSHSYSLEVVTVMAVEASEVAALSRRVEVQGDVAEENVRAPDSSTLVSALLW
jgi:hypothetical protein